MLDYLENLRNRPEAERRKAVLKISLFITLGIALIWGVAMYMKVSRMDFSTGEKVDSVPSLTDTFSNIKGTFKDIFRK